MSTNTPKKRGGFLGALLSEISEPDPAASVAPTPASPPPVTAASSPTLVGVATLGAQSPVQVSPEALETVRKEVYGNVKGRASVFVKFMKMWEAMQRPGDVSTVFNVLKISEPQVTAVDIQADLAEHIALLDSVHSKAEAELGALANDRLGGVDREITALQDSQKRAQEEIARHTAESLQRSTKITELQTLRAQDEAKINATKQSVFAAESIVRSELTQMQSLLTVLR